VGVSGLDDLEGRTWRALLGAHWRLLSRLDAELQSAQQISVAEFEVLVQLAENSEGMLRMSELAERTQLSPSGLTRRLDSLVRTGLVERVRCEYDRRGSYARITIVGRRRLEGAVPDHVEQVRRHFIDRLTRRQLAALAEALEKVAGDSLCERTSGTRRSRS
jgi:DNA-binding MarR family transcriptional regulator